MKDQPHVAVERNEEFPNQLDIKTRKDEWASLYEHDDFLLALHDSLAPKFVHRHMTDNLINAVREAAAIYVDHLDPWKDHNGLWHWKPR